MTIFGVYIYRMARDIRTAIDELGGISQVAKDLGHRSHTSVQYWHRNNKLPRWRWSELSGLAKRRGVKMPMQE